LTRIAEGREAEIFSWDATSVLKLYRSEEFTVRAEETALGILASAPGIAPTVREVVHLDGRPGLVMERVEGTDMLSLLQKNPLRLFSFARGLADVQVRIHETPAPAALPETRSRLAERISYGAPHGLREFALRVLDGLTDGDRLCHGDLHPGNVMVSPSRLAVIDWSGASRGDPIGDHGRTSLLLSMGDPPPGTARAFRMIIGVGRGLFSSAYRKSYARAIPVASDVRRRWEIVHAAARFAEGIEVEYPTLTALLEKARAERT